MAWKDTERHRRVLWRGAVGEKLKELKGRVYAVGTEGEKEELEGELKLNDELRGMQRAAAGAQLKADEETARELEGTAANFGEEVRRASAHQRSAAESEHSEGAAA